MNCNFSFQYSDGHFNNHEDFIKYPHMMHQDAVDSQYPPFDSGGEASGPYYLDRPRPAPRPDFRLSTCFGQYAQHEYQGDHDFNSRSHKTLNRTPFGHGRCTRRGVAGEMRERRNSHADVRMSIFEEESTFDTDMESHADETEMHRSPPPEDGLALIPPQHREGCDNKWRLNMAGMAGQLLTKQVPPNFAIQYMQNLLREQAEVGRGSTNKTADPHATETRFNIINPVRSRGHIRIEISGAVPEMSQSPESPTFIGTPDYEQDSSRTPRMESFSMNDGPGSQPFIPSPLRKAIETFEERQRRPYHAQGPSAGSPVPHRTTSIEIKPSVTYIGDHRNVSRSARGTADEDVFMSGALPCDDAGRCNHGSRKKNHSRVRFASTEPMPGDEPSQQPRQKARRSVKISTPAAVCNHGYRTRQSLGRHGN